MWMMGYNERDDQLNTTCNNGATRKLRPLVPRPPPTTVFHSTPHLVSAEQNKRDFNSQQMVVVSSRWNPTPEQLQTLEELYRRGTRTPSADEIQHITAQLRRYGKIEGKNVFYWFQNHKARERQKRRRQLDNSMNDHHQTPFYATDINNINLDQSIQLKDSEVNRTCYEVEETRNWAIPTFSEKSIVLRERTAKAESRMTSVAADQQEWIPVEQEEAATADDLLHLHPHPRRKTFPQRNATWNHMMHFLSSPPPPTNHNNIFPFNSATVCTTVTTTSTPSASDTSSTYVVSPPHSHRYHHHFPRDHMHSNYQTLELFPVNTNGGQGREQTEKCFLPENDVSLGPRQFIEFLPLKN